MMVHLLFGKRRRCHYLSQVQGKFLQRGSMPCLQKDHAVPLHEIPGLAVIKYKIFRPRHIIKITETVSADTFCRIRKGYLFVQYPDTLIPARFSLIQIFKDIFGAVGITASEKALKNHHVFPQLHLLEYLLVQIFLAGGTAPDHPPPCLYRLGAPQFPDGLRCTMAFRITDQFSGIDRYTPHRLIRKKRTALRKPAIYLLYFFFFCCEKPGSDLIHEIKDKFLIQDILLFSRENRFHLTVCPQYFLYLILIIRNLAQGRKPHRIIVLSFQIENLLCL